MLLRRDANTQSAVLAAQVAEVIRDLAELKSEQNARWDKHELAHKAAEDARVAGRRWLIGVGLAGVGAIGALYPWVYFLIRPR